MTTYVGDNTVITTLECGPMDAVCTIIHHKPTHQITLIDVGGDVQAVIDVCITCASVLCLDSTVVFTD